MATFILGSSEVGLSFSVGYGLRGREFMDALPMSYISVVNVR